MSEKRPTEFTNDSAGQYKTRQTFLGELGLGGYALHRAVVAAK
ncbi:MAG: hypothetical protein OXH92_12940 [Bryobacterales bacterium]|nr:hypothetical protein [Bryobacterales bacterium]